MTLATAASGISARVSAISRSLPLRWMGKILDDQPHVDAGFTHQAREQVLQPVGQRQIDRLDAVAGVENLAHRRNDPTLSGRLGSRDLHDGREGQRQRERADGLDSSIHASPSPSRSA